MIYHDEQYNQLLHDIRHNGEKKPIYGHDDKYILSLFGRILNFDLSQAFPLLTGKKVFWRGVVEELLWFMAGDNNASNLIKKDIHIWDEWVYKRYLEWHKVLYGEGVPPKTQKSLIDEIKSGGEGADAIGILPGIYGEQWRFWRAPNGDKVDQLAWALWKLRNPSQRDRKHIVVSAWNPPYIYEMASYYSPVVLPPCHYAFQFNVANDKLSCMVNMRSCDAPLGLPFNIASYALLTHIMAALSGLHVGNLVMSLADVHIYSDQINGVEEQLSRPLIASPSLSVDPDAVKRNTFAKDPFINWSYEDFTIHNYAPHAKIGIPVTAVGGFDKDNDFQNNR